MRELIERLDQIVSLVDRIAQAGEMTRLESRLFRVERAVRIAEFAALEAEAGEAELALKALLGLPPAAAVTLVPAISPRVAAAGQNIDPEVGERDDRNAELAISLAEYAVAERTLELEVRRQYPDLTIGPGYGREDGQDQFLLGLSIPLPILNRNQQGIAMAEAQRDLARAGYETTSERIAGELARARLLLRSAIVQRETLEREVVPLVDEQYAETRQIAELGEIDTLVLLETLSRQQETKMRLIEAIAAESHARIRIEELLGPPAEAPAPDPQPEPTPSHGAQP